MAHIFKAIFIRTENDEIIEKAKDKWSGLRIKRTDFVSIAGPDWHEDKLKIGDKIQRELPQLSKEFPDDTFVFLYANCWGPLIAYQGYACKEGAKYLEINSSGLSEQHNAMVLQLLMGQLGVTVRDDGFFEPLTREYFTKSQPLK